MDELRFQTIYLPHIVKQVSIGSLILFTGAGFSQEASSVSRRNIPGTWELTNKIWDIIYRGEPYEAGNELKDLFDQALKHHHQELECLLNNELRCTDSGQPDWYKLLLSLPWLRAYTLNADDLLEVVGEQSQPHGRDVVSISATTKSLSDMRDNALNVIHINGSINDRIEDLIFSRSQYTNKKNADFYDLLRTDLMQRPVIFIGSKLEEDLFWETIISRGEKGERSNKEQRPRSYLVIPELPKSKATLLENYNITWLPMTGRQFIERIYEDVRPELEHGFGVLSARSVQPGGRRKQFQHLSDAIAMANTDSDYLMGAEPSWDDVVKRRVVQRCCFSEIYEKCNEILSSSEIQKFLVVTGTAGSGKSSCIMWLGLKLNSEGLNVYWVDEEYIYTNTEFKNSLDNNDSIDVLLINNADIYDQRLSDLIHYILSARKRILVIVELRSSKVDKCINPFRLDKIQPVEFGIPHLSDRDIGGLIDVLDRENRLGILKGASNIYRVNAFKKNANRQLLVAMYQATSGKRFEERAAHELNELDGISKFIYGLVCFVTYYRYSITKDEILLAYDDPDNTVLNHLERLHARKLIHTTNIAGERFRSRHREIARMVCDELRGTGQAYGVIAGLFRVGVAKVGQSTHRASREAKMLRHFCNHNFLSETVSVEQARILYADFEYGLSWDSHYWLHRGALELEQDNLPLAENFLNQAESLRANDHLILTEQSYLLFKKALLDPTAVRSHAMVDEAVENLVYVINAGTDSPHPCDILCRQGLRWIDKAMLTKDKKIEFLEFLQGQIKLVLSSGISDERLSGLERSIRESLLRLAIPD